MDLFVYGTLTDPEQAATVLTDFEYRDSAVLDGLHRVEGSYPTLAPGRRVEGRILSTDEIDALDRYEGVERGLYVRVPVPVEDRNRTVETYVGDPNALDAPVAWPGSKSGPESEPESFADRVRDYLAERDVTVVIDDRDS